MQSLQDLHLFDDDQNFQKQKEESINELIKDPYIMKVLSDGQVGRDFIEENWVEFLDFQEDVQKCKDCMGLYQCHKVSMPVILALLYCVCKKGGLSHLFGGCGCGCK